MKISNRINPQIIQAAVSMLEQYIPEISPKRLVAAIQEYDCELKEQEAVNARPKQPYTVQEACRLLRISRPTLDQRAKEGLIRKLKVGRGVRIPAEDIDKLLGN